LYSTVLGRLLAVNAEHPPWRLRRAELDDLRQDLTGAAHLPPPPAATLAHAANGVRVRIGRSRLIKT
jgi:uncharacterized protein YqjF (DUF2071 family)